MNRNVFNSDDKMNGSNHEGFDKNWEIPHLSHCFHLKIYLSNSNDSIINLRENNYNFKNRHKVYMLVKKKMEF